MNHWGHVHFFLLGFDWGRGGGDAFSGSQQFHFELKDTWGPRSQDPNQQQQYRVVGTPKWEFHIQELWRRVYIQQWDEKTPVSGGGIVGRRGIKYDASQRGQTFGPFREGQKFSPLFIDSARTLPVEYYNSESRDRLFRDNYVKAKYRAAGDQARIPFGDGTLFDIPPDNSLPVKGAAGGTPTWADGLYIYPTMEYQKVVQLDWGRLPGYAAKNDIDAENFGDGWAVDVEIPFRDPETQKYRSPFGPSPGVVAPAGQYFNNLVSPAARMKFRPAENAPPTPESPEGGYDYKNQPFGLSDADGGQPLVFKDPFGNSDGRWVQQCIGGIVQARATVTIESKLGGRFDQVVSSTQYLPADSFAGTDQLAGASNE